jgi:osmotically-inducible protein OsmY
MFGGDKATDKELLKTVGKRLSRGGGGRINAAVQQGTVTLSGNIQYEAQRRPLVKAVSGIAGVRSVIDQIRLTPKSTN